MPNLLTAIASQVLTSTAASVTFSTIPAGYTDLMLKVRARGDYAGKFLYFRVTMNGDSSALYSDTYLEGSGSAGASGRDSAGTLINVMGSFPCATATANTFGNAEIVLPNYTSTANKPLSGFGVSEDNATAADMILAAGLYRNTSAITSITIGSASGNFIAASRFDLFGILKG